ncbi:hypothetical protein BDC45DRAFT_609505 [Circinella umbellata]|nr:hypothetical protein BDC45DRAFT_609505 [Circinella umbellata]
MPVTSSSIPKQKISPLLHKNREQYFSSSTKDQASTNAFYPALPEIQKDLNTTPTMANAIVAIQSLLSGLLSAIWASYSSQYGTV